MSYFRVSPAATEYFLPSPGPLLSLLGNMDYGGTRRTGSSGNRDGGSSLKLDNMLPGDYQFIGSSLQANEQGYKEVEQEILQTAMKSSNPLKTMRTWGASKLSEASAAYEKNKMQIMSYVPQLQEIFTRHNTNMTDIYKKGFTLSSPIDDGYGNLMPDKENKSRIKRLADREFMIQSMPNEVSSYSEWTPPDIEGFYTEWETIVKDFKNNEEKTKETTSGGKTYKLGYYSQNNELPDLPYNDVTNVIAINKAYEYFMNKVANTPKLSRAYNYMMNIAKYNKEYKYDEATNKMIPTNDPFNKEEWGKDLLTNLQSSGYKSFFNESINTTGDGTDGDEERNKLKTNFLWDLCFIPKEELGKKWGATTLQMDFLSDLKVSEFNINAMTNLFSPLVSKYPKLNALVQDVTKAGEDFDAAYKAYIEGNLDTLISSTVIKSGPGAYDIFKKQLPYLSSTSSGNSLTSPYSKFEDILMAADAKMIAETPRLKDIADLLTTEGGMEQINKDETLSYLYEEYQTRRKVAMANAKYDYQANVLSKYMNELMNIASSKEAVDMEEKYKSDYSHTKVFNRGKKLTDNEKKEKENLENIIHLRQILGLTETSTEEYSEGGNYGLKTTWASIKTTWASIKEGVGIKPKTIGWKDIFREQAILPDFYNTWMVNAPAYMNESTESFTPSYLYQPLNNATMYESAPLGFIYDNQQFMSANKASNDDLIVVKANRFYKYVPFTLKDGTKKLMIGINATIAVRKDGTIYQGNDNFTTFDEKTLSITTTSLKRAIKGDDLKSGTLSQYMKQKELNEFGVNVRNAEYYFIDVVIPYTSIGIDAETLGEQYPIDAYDRYEEAYGEKYQLPVDKTSQNNQIIVSDTLNKR